MLSIDFASFDSPIDSFRKRKTTKIQQQVTQDNKWDM